MPDIAGQDEIVLGASDHFISRRNSDGELTRTKPSDVPLGAPFGGAGISDEVLKMEGYHMTSITYDSDEVIVSATVIWPDGSGGVFTTVEVDSEELLINSYTVTHTVSGKTVTQPTITRDAAGNPSVIPAKTVA